jgi:hypothetical protein
VFGGIHFGIAAEGGKVFVPVTDLADGGTYPILSRCGRSRRRDARAFRAVKGRMTEALCVCYRIPGTQYLIVQSA